METETEIPCRGTWVYDGDNAGGHKVFTSADWHKLIMPVSEAGHRCQMECSLAVAAGSRRPGRKQSVPDTVVERAREMLELRDENRKYTGGYKYTLTEVAKLLNISSNTLHRRLQINGRTIAEQRREAARQQQAEEKT